MQRRLSTRSVAARLFLTCWLVFVLHFATNTVREIYPALSLGDHLSFDVSEYVGLHPDIFVMEGRGAYINNNPGASMLGALPYALTRPVIDKVVAGIQAARAGSPASTAGYDSIYPMAREFYEQARERGLDVKFGLAAGVMQSLLMAPLGALSVVVMFYLLRHLTHSTRTAALLSLLYAFATPVLYRTAQLNQNILVGYCALFGFALLYPDWDHPPLTPRLRYLAAGLLAGWAVVLDYSGLIVVAGLTGYALLVWRAPAPAARRLAPLMGFAAGVAVGLAILMAYQWHAFGHPLYPAQSYMPPANFTDQGYRGFSWPQLDLLSETAFGIRYGLFTSAPLLLLALYVPGWLGRGSLLRRRDAVWMAAFCLLFFVFAAANQYGRMQFNSGVRHIVPVTPFIFLLAASTLVRFPRWLAYTIGIITVYWSWCLAMYRDVEQGLGVFEALAHVTLEGPRLPWLTTLVNMGYAPLSLVVPILAVAMTVIVALWVFDLPQRRPSVATASSRVPPATLGSKETT